MPTLTCSVSRVVMMKTSALPEEVAVAVVVPDVVVVVVEAALIALILTEVADVVVETSLSSMTTLSPLFEDVEMSF